jgi:hypothetical protein
MFTLKELSAKVSDLLSRADAGLRAEFATLKTLVDTTLADTQDKLTQALADLGTAQASVKSLGEQNTELTNTNQKLKLDSDALAQSSTAAATSLRSHLATIPGHEDYKDGGSKAAASLPELIAAEQSATNTALASVGIKPETIPAAGAVPAAAVKTPANLTDACLKANKKA